MIATGTPVVLVRHKGAFHAVQNNCSHRDFPLSEAGFDPRDGVLVCAWHGGCFDVHTGAAVVPPATEPVETFPVRVTDGWVECEVRDQGSGIDPGFLPHVFERFRQGDATATRTHGGLGLGLAIVKNLVDLHGGAVAAASDGNGKGATFRVRLPLFTTDLMGGPAPRADALRGRRVLLVNEDAATLHALGDLLEAEGAQVIAAAGARDALAHAADTGFELLLVDLGLGEMEAGTLLAEPAAWTVPISFAVMVLGSLATQKQVPADVGRTMVQLHAPERLRLHR